MANNPQSTVDNLVGSTVKAGENAVNTVINQPIQRVTDSISDTGFGKALRAIGLLPGAVPTGGIGFTPANWGSKTDLDWRVRLSIPSDFRSSPLLQPLIETNGFMWPYTPQIILEHSANYNSLHPTHSNYPFPQYQNSQIEDIVITGDFFVENAKDAQYWVAMTHFLRSVTKMDYGKGQNSGAPPPLIFLNGYGDFVFPNVPVVVRNFTFDLPADVDYIKTQASGEISTGPTTGDPKGKAGFVPTQSQVSITVAPVYSRAKTSQFNLDKFVKGDYLGTNGNNGGGFI